jgi:hypothetical protein
MNYQHNLLFNPYLYSTTLIPLLAISISWWWPKWDFRGSLFPPPPCSGIWQLSRWSVSQLYSFLPLLSAIFFFLDSQSVKVLEPTLLLTSSLIRHFLFCFLDSQSAKFFSNFTPSFLSYPPFSFLLFYIVSL